MIKIVINTILWVASEWFSEETKGILVDPGYILCQSLLKLLLQQQCFFWSALYWAGHRKVSACQTLAGDYTWPSSQENLATSTVILKLQDITDQNTHIYTLIIQNDKAPSQLQIYSFTLANHVQGHINKQEWFDKQYDYIENNLVTVPEV